MSNKAISKLDDWHFRSRNGAVDVLEDKQGIIEQLEDEMLNRCFSMLEFKNLPSTIDENYLKRILFTKGYVPFFELDGGTTQNNDFYDIGIYCHDGAFGGVLDNNDIPTWMIVNIPYFNLSKIMRIGKDCEILRCTPIYSGIWGIISRYADLIAETFVTLDFSLVNERIPTIVHADNDQAKDDFEKFYSDVRKGGKISAIGGNPFFEGIKTAIYNASREGRFQDLMELIQWLKANWLIELGLQANYNMKREAINSSEAGMNESALTPLIDTILSTIQADLIKINEKFGTSIECDLSSAWKRTREELVAKAEILENQAMATEEIEPKSEGGKKDDME